MFKPEISIIIPLYNEEERLQGLFVALESFFSTDTWSLSEVILVDDGSTDKTLLLIKSFQQKYSKVIKIISYPTNQGKGFAIRSGMLGASLKWRIFIDADLSVSLDQINELVRYMDKDKVVIIGNRNLEGSKILLYQSIIRRSLGKGYTIIANIITGVAVSDFTCGFKCFSNKATEIIFKQAKINRWSFDAEILYLAKKNNIQIIEVAVTWENKEDTKVVLMKDIFQSFIDLIRIRFIHKIMT